MTESELSDSVPQEVEAGVDGGSDMATGGETVSQKLVRAREASGLSQKEVADELFLTTTFIRYIDDGDFRKIPKPAFIKGYLRSYARVVSLDGDDLVAAFEKEQNITPPTPRVMDVTESAEPPGAGFGSPLVQTGIFGLVGVIAVGALVWWLATEDSVEPEPVVRSIDEVADPTVPRVQVDDATSRAPIIEPVVEQPAVETMPETMLDEPAPAPETDSDVTGDSGQAPVAVTEESVDASTPVDVQIERVFEDGVNYITVYGGGDATMAFEFSDECWVEITDADGNRIYGDLNREGDVMTVYGKRPFDVLLGRAPAVEMTVEGERVNLDRFSTRDQTARIRTARL